MVNAIEKPLPQPCFFSVHVLVLYCGEGKYSSFRCEVGVFGHFLKMSSILLDEWLMMLGFVCPSTRLHVIAGTA